jgi:CRISPR/Cas system-associated endonuclease Cas1
VFVFYFAVNKTNVYITPEVTIKTATKNLYFEVEQTESAFQEENSIPLKEISKIVSITETFGTT